MASTTKRISLKSLLYVWYAHPDLKTSHKFLTDFGLIPVKEAPDRIFYRGFGDSPVCYISDRAKNGKAEFQGGGWAVDTYEDLEAATKLEGATPIADANEAIGGKTVTLVDPAGGSIHLHWGHHPRQIKQGDEPKKLYINRWDEKPRKGEFQRLASGPSYVHKLGHYGYELNHSEFKQTRQWYLETFTLTTTDSIYDPGSGEDIMTFIHLDKGEEYVDHHNFFLAAGQNPNRDVHHASFEVDDVDSELKGHNHLKAQGWSLVLGVGRHLLGSQIFDYWFDNDAFVLEHYADGDMVNCNNPPQRIAAGPESIAIWGPEVPLGFMTRRPEDMDKMLFGKGGPGGPSAGSSAQA